MTHPSALWRSLCTSRLLSPASITGLLAFTVLQAGSPAAAQVITEQLKIGSPSPNASAVAVDGSVLLLGAYSPAGPGGTAYLFDVGTGLQGFELTPGDGAAGDGFGTAVALDGTTALVGARGADSAYLFDILTGVEIAQLQPSVAAAGFGWSVALSGTTAVVSAQETELFSFNDVVGLAFDPGASILYGTDKWADQLITIDSATGLGTPVGPIGFGAVTGLAFDPVARILYGVDNTTDQLITIDVTTGAGSAVGPTGAGVGASVRGLAFDPGTGTLYGAKRDAAAVMKLSILDTSTGLQSEVGSLGYDKVHGLSFDSATSTLFGQVYGTDELLVIDTTTGAGTLVGSPFPPGCQGLAFDPTTGTLHGGYGHHLWTANPATGAGSSVGSYSHIAYTGSAYVFERDEGGPGAWGEVGEFLTGSGAGKQDFGYSVALSGSSALVGTHSVGSAYVFDTTTATLTRELTFAPGGKGTAVALDGTTALIGDPGAEAAYLFDTVTAGKEQVLLPGWHPDQTEFGRSVALQGNTAVVGAPWTNFGCWNFYCSEQNVGEVYVYVLSTGAGPSVLAGYSLTASDGTNGDYLGTSVAIDGKSVIAIAPYAGMGAAYAFDFDFPTSSVVVNYCTAGTSASGCTATLSATGTPGASAASGFVVQAAGVEGGKLGLYFFGINGRGAFPWGNGSSYQCMLPPVRRGGPLASSGSAGLCNGAFSQDLNAFWSANPAKLPGLGLAQVQLWYRDPANTSGTTTSLSDALEFQIGL